METLVGEDVYLQCLGTITTEEILTISWTQGDGTRLFNCDRLSRHHCETNTTTHTLGRNDMFISTLTIRNVSLVHEDKYNFLMISANNRMTCRINLTVNGIYRLNNDFQIMISTLQNTLNIQLLL